MEEKKEIIKTDTTENKIGRKKMDVSVLEESLNSEEKRQAYAAKKPIMYQLEKKEEKYEDDKCLDVIQVNKKKKNKKMIDKEEPIEEKWKIFLFGLLGFFVPIAGLAVYLAMKENYPKLSIAAGIGALCNVVGFVLLFLIFATLFLVGIGAIFV